MDLGGHWISLCLFPNVSSLNVFPLYCFLLLHLQFWLIFQGLWPKLASLSIEYNPKFGNRVATMKLLKTHFSGGDRLIYYRHVSLFSLGLASVPFCLYLVKKKNDCLILFCILTNTLSLKSLSPICATWSLVHICLLFGLLSHLVMDLIFVELLVGQALSVRKLFQDFVETTIWQEKAGAVLSH